MKRVLSMFLVLVMAAPIAAIAETTATPAESQQSQKKQVSGVVTDKSGVPVIGAAIAVPGTSTGTVTDANGRYSLVVPNGTKVLEVSCIGYTTQNISVGVASKYDVVLSEDSLMLTETVVVGYGTMKKGEVASAISTVKSGDFLKTPGANAAELIKGKVPGLIVNTPDGNPVSSTQISLRGATTLKAGTAPLVLIDGVPGSLSQVSPDDIEQIDVLKDGSAAAIYGTRGTNGVIIITTKNTQGEAPTSVDFNAYVSTQQITKTLDYLTADEYRQLAKGHVGFHDDGASVNWLDEITRTPLSQIYNISLRGGSKQTNYVASFEYRGLQGVMRLSNNNMMFPRIDITHRMFDSKVKLHGSINGFTMKYHNGSDGALSTLRFGMASITTLRLLSANLMGLIQRTLVLRITTTRCRCSMRPRAVLTPPCCVCSVMSPIPLSSVLISRLLSPGIYTTRLRDTMKPIIILTRQERRRMASRRVVLIEASRTCSNLPPNGRAHSFRTTTTPSSPDIHTLTMSVKTTGCRIPVLRLMTTSTTI